MQQCWKLSKPIECMHLLPCSSIQLKLQLGPQTAQATLFCAFTEHASLFDFPFWQPTLLCLPQWVKDGLTLHLAFQVWGIFFGSCVLIQL